MHDHILDMLIQRYNRPIMNNLQRGDYVECMIAFYPCQSVIAVGEVKSTLNRGELRNIWEKATSVRKLRRYSRGSRIGGVNEKAFFRPYGSSTIVRGEPNRHHDQDRIGTDQIMIFGLSGQLGTRVDAIRGETGRLLTVHGRENAPDVVGVLDTGDLFIPTRKTDSSGKSKAAISFLEATHSTHVGSNAAVFRWIVFQIWQRYCFGFTAPVYEMVDYFQIPGGWGILAPSD